MLVPLPRAPREEKKLRVFGAAAAISWGVGTYAVLTEPARTRIHSVFWKKNSLFLITGPPTENPNWLRVKTGFGIPFALLLKLFDARVETRLYSYALPWN